MVHPNLGRLTIMALLVAASAYGDTVTTTDNLSVHGTIKEVTATTITLEGKFGSGTKSYTIPRKNVIRIDLNSIVFNPGAPPKTVGLGPADDNKKNPQPQVSQEDTIVLKGNIRRPCKLVGIDATTIHCQDVDYPRSKTLYILVGGGQ